METRSPKLTLPALFLCAAVSIAATTGVPGPGPVSDDFDRTNLDLSTWTFVNPLGDGQLAMVGAGSGDAHLALSVPAGTPHDAWGSGGMNECPRVSQSCPDTDFEVAAKFNAEPTAGFNDQGIFVEQDASNWLRFDIYHSGSQLKAFIGKTVGGSTSSSLNATIAGGSATHLRVRRTADTFDFEISPDGAVWTLAGSITQAFTVSSVGVFAGNPVDGLAFTSEVDWFFNTASPISPEDGGAPADADSPLNHSIGAAAGLNQITVNWFTDEPCTGTVEYGETTSYELGSMSDGGGLYAHSVVIGSLSTGVTYHYRVSSDDGTNPVSTSGDFTVFLDPTGPVVDVWYGLAQTVGTFGQTQPWYNVLGHVSDPDGVASLSYKLNGGTAVPLTIGPDGRRLENVGDFNVDLALEDLVAGSNSVEITAVDGASNSTVTTVTVDYVTGNVWPQTFSIDWGTVSDIQERAQVVDGKWSLEGIGVRTAEPGYDRLIAAGDTCWDDYEVECQITMNSLSPSSGGVGILMRWNGHTDYPIAGTQPKSGYLPLGCIGWYRNGRVELYGNDADILDTDPRVLSNGVTYNYKMRVETTPGVGATYRLKVWEDGMSEPLTWDVEGSDTLSDPQFGSFMLISHQYDVTFGDVTVTPIVGAPNVAPVANADTVYVLPAGSIEFEPLANDTDSDGTVCPVTLNVTQAPANGTLDVNPTTGRMAYTHDGSATTTDEVRYTVEDNDGAVSNEAIVSIAITPNPPQAFLSDDFNCGYDAGLWTFIDAVGDCSFDYVGTGSGDVHLALTLPAGTAHDAWGPGGVNQGARFMQSAANSDFEMTVKWNAEPTADYHDQGIIVEEDGSNWLRFDVYHTGSQLKAFIGARIGGSNTTILNATVTPGTASYARLTRSGNLYTFDLSNDGATWSPAGSTTQALIVGQVGVYAGNPVVGSAFTSEVDYVFEADTAIDPEDASPCAESFCAPSIGAPVVSGTPSFGSSFSISTFPFVDPPCSGSNVLLFGQCASTPIVVPPELTCGTCPLAIGEVWGTSSMIGIGPGDLPVGFTFCVQSGCIAMPAMDPACINLSAAVEITIAP
ncbi:MAG: DUF1349 domain-containing protein [Planctomycetes bacterium]|nr:DUF1349 domain-containing protein [Planctomycetota bacterium]